MIKTREEIIDAVKTRMGEDTSDESIAFLEDITDTLNDYEERANGDGTDWKAEAERIDREWREKYISRFDSASTKEKEEPKEKEAEKEIRTFDDLFKTED